MVCVLTKIFRLTALYTLIVHLIINVNDTSKLFASSNRSFLFRLTFRIIKESNIYIYLSTKTVTIKIRIKTLFIGRYYIMLDDWR